MMESGLYLIGTPIGNLGDISFRAIETLKNVDLIYAEDTRHTRKLTNKYNISTKVLSCHKFNEAKKSEEILKHIYDGKSIGLVTDSGMPGISDPGNRIVKVCRSAQMNIEVIPGPTALTTAISKSGQCDKGFIFIGFLPHKSGGRKRDLQLWKSIHLPVVFYESPYRLIKFIDEVEKYISSSKKLIIFRELTKKYEEYIEGTPSEIRDHFKEKSIKGEIVILLMPNN